MGIRANFNEGELVIIGTTKAVNTPENLINLSMQISKESGKEITIFSERITMSHLPEKGIILVDNPSELSARMISSLYHRTRKTGATIIVIINTPIVKDMEGREEADLRYVDGYCYFINYCDRALLWEMDGDNSKLELILCHGDDNPVTKYTCNWLLRRDGEIFEMEGDVVIDGEPFLEVQLNNIVWLFEHTLRKETKRHITAFVRKLCITNGRPWEKEYIDEHLGSKLKKIAEHECDSAGYLGVYDYFDKVLFDFDEEFLHVCFGGEYHPVMGNRDLFFRISSEDFDWSNVIEEFKSNIDITYEDEHIRIDKFAKERNPKVGTKDEGEGLWYFYG